MNGRIRNLETAFKPLMDLYLDWQEHNVMNDEDNQLTLVQYIERHSDNEALENVLERAYEVYQDESEATNDNR